MADHTTIPFGARFWRLWRPVWRLRHKANGFLFPALLLFWVLLLISPYIVINRIAAWAEHTPVQEESIPPEKKLKESRQDQRTAWDPKSLFRDSEGQFLDYKIPAIDWTIWFYLSLFGYYCAFFAAQKNDRGRAESLVMAQAWVVSSWIAYPIFALLPADIDLRWQLNMEQMTPLYQFLFKAFHTLDEPFNAWPCLHIAQSFVSLSPGAVVAATQLDRGGLAALAGLAWPVRQRDDHQAALHLGHHHRHAARHRRLGLVDAARLPASRHGDR